MLRYVTTNQGKVREAEEYLDGAPTDSDEAAGDEEEENPVVEDVFAEDREDAGTADD